MLLLERTPGSIPSTHMRWLKLSMTTVLGDLVSPFSPPQAPAHTRCQTYTQTHRQTHKIRKCLNKNNNISSLLAKLLETCDLHGYSTVKAEQILPHEFSLLIKLMARYNTLKQRRRTIGNMFFRTYELRNKSWRKKINTPKFIN